MYIHHLFKINIEIKKIYWYIIRKFIIYNLFYYNKILKIKSTTLKLFLLTNKFWNIINIKYKIML